MCSIYIIRGRNQFTLEMWEEFVFKATITLRFMDHRFTTGVEGILK